jgi:hypothetical protein
MMSMVVLSNAERSFELRFTAVLVVESYILQSGAVWTKRLIERNGSLLWRITVLKRCGKRWLTHATTIFYTRRMRHVGYDWLRDLSRSGFTPSGVFSCKYNIHGWLTSICNQAYCEVAGKQLWLPIRSLTNSTLRATQDSAVYFSAFLP